MNEIIPMLEIEEGVWGRPGTTDQGVWQTTRDSAHHLPLEDIGDVRTVLDLGCNAGYTTIDYARRWTNARIIGVEIDPDTARVAERNAEPYRDRVSIVCAAVWDRDNDTVFWRGDAPSTRTAMGGGDRVSPTISVPHLLAMLPLIKPPGPSQLDFAKVDIEGAEIKLLDDIERWASWVRTIRMDVHPNTCWDIHDAAGILRATGFDVEMPWDESIWAVRR